MMSVFISSTLNAQQTNDLTTHTPYALSIHGGYSWLDGVVGADFQSGLFGLTGGWMPTTMPMTGENINSFGFAASLYSGPPTDIYTFYLSVGVASDGYQYEDSYGYGGTEPVTIVMVGSKYNGNRVYFKAGIGYGWNEYTGVWTGELTLGIPLFKNY